MTALPAHNHRESVRTALAFLAAAAVGLVFLWMGWSLAR